MTLGVEAFGRLALGQGDDEGLSAYTLTANYGAFTLTGQAAGLAIGRVLSAETGVFTLTGQDVGFALQVTLVAETGMFAVTGQSAGLSLGTVLACETGVFTLTFVSGAELSVRRRRLTATVRVGRPTVRGKLYGT
ncbi:MAG: hypothetical protein AB7O43_17740 [Hyphomicrobiaceae bacterium]